MKSIIIYATKHGSAEKAAKMLKEKLKGEVILINIMKEEVPPLEEYDNVILGGSIYMGKIEKELSGYIKGNLSKLVVKRIGLFICGALKDTKKLAKELDETFPEELVNIASAKGVFGYEFNFEKLSFWEKKLTSAIMGIKSSVSNLSKEAICDFANAINE